MKVLTFVIIATVFEAVGDAVMRIALQSPYALPGRIALFALASVLLTMYGLFLNLAPVEFATVDRDLSRVIVYRVSSRQLSFLSHTSSPGVLVGGAFIVTGAAIIYFWK
jgi:small multidrug resistance family-3 protein